MLDPGDFPHEGAMPVIIDRSIVDRSSDGLWLGHRHVPGGSVSHHRADDAWSGLHRP